MGAARPPRLRDLARDGKAPLIGGRHDDEPLPLVGNSGGSSLASGPTNRERRSAKRPRKEKKRIVGGGMEQKIRESYDS